MNKKPITVEIEDLREIVGGGSELTLAPKSGKDAGSKAPWPGGGTTMCYRFAPSPDDEVWTKIRGTEK